MPSLFTSAQATVCGGHVANWLFLETDAYHTLATSLRWRDGKSAFELKNVLYFM